MSVECLCVTVHVLISANLWYLLTNENRKCCLSCLIIVIRIFFKFCIQCERESQRERKREREIERERILMFLLFCFFFRGLYITIYDKGHIFDILCNWTIDDVKVCLLFILRQYSLPHIHNNILQGPRSWSLVIRQLVWNTVPKHT